MLENQNRREEQPQWLAEQQHHSYQIEILIAGGAILFLAQMPDYFREFLVANIQKGDLEAEVAIMAYGGHIFSRALLIGFITNLLLRALWLAYLGINYSFPQGVNYQKLKFSDYFQQKAKKSSSTVQRILKLEKICSLSYSFAIIMTLIAFGLFFLLVILFFIIHYTLPALYRPDWGFFFFLVFGFMMLGVLDFIFFRLLRKVESVSKWYYPFYKFFGWISLSFLYRKEWLVLVSNSRQWLILLIFTTYFIIAFWFASFEMRDLFGRQSAFRTTFTTDWMEKREFAELPTFLSMRAQNYDDLIEEKQQILTMSLNSRIIEKNWLSVFVVYWKEFDPPLKRIFENNEVETSLDSLRWWSHLEGNDPNISKSLSQFLHVEIDNKRQDSLTWFYHRHPKTDEIGFISYLPLDSISSGPHAVKVIRHRLRADTLSLTAGVAVVPFVKE